MPVGNSDPICSFMDQHMALLLGPNMQRRSLLGLDVVVCRSATLYDADVQTGQQSNTGDHEQPEEKPVDDARQFLPFVDLVFSSCAATAAYCTVTSVYSPVWTVWKEYEVAVEFRRSSKNDVGVIVDVVDGERVDHTTAMIGQLDVVATLTTNRRPYVAIPAGRCLSQLAVQRGWRRRRRRRPRDDWACGRLGNIIVEEHSTQTVWNTCRRVFTQVNVSDDH